MPEPVEALDTDEAKKAPASIPLATQTRTTLAATGPERVCPPWWRTELTGTAPAIIGACRQVKAPRYGFTNQPIPHAGLWRGAAKVL